MAATLLPGCPEKRIDPGGHCDEADHQEGERPAVRPEMPEPQE